MSDFDKAIKLSSWKLSEASYNVYASMWQGFCHRLLLQQTTPLTATSSQLLGAIKGGGQYATQKRLYALFSTVSKILRRADPSLGDNSRELRRMFLRDARPDCDALPSEQLLLLAQAAPSLVRGWKGLRLAAMLAVLRETGLRNNEVLTLSQSSITFGPPAMLHVGCPPTSRFFHLSDFCAERLCMWLAAHPCKTRTELLFVANEYGGTLDTSTVWRQINRLSTKVLGIEIRGMGVGRIRASVAKQLQDEGASAVEIQYFLGHKQETSTAELLDRIHVGGFDA